MMHPSGSTRGGGSWASNDDMLIFSVIVTVLGIAVFGYLAWSTYHGEISAAVIAWRRWEIGLLAHFTDAFALADRQMAAANPYRVTLASLYRISHAVGAAWRLPACIAMLLLAILCFWRNAPGRYRRPMDLTRLARELAQIFPATGAFLDQKLRLVPPSFQAVRPADYALTAEEWIDGCARAKDGSLDEIRARRALVMQLGQRWAGASDLPPAAMVLFIAFSRHLCGQRDEAANLLGAAGDCLEGPDALDDGRGPPAPLTIATSLVAECRATLRDRAAFGPAEAVMGRHAWTTTGLMSLLNAARMQSGVLAPAQFAWLKLVDRSLWYALQSLGFETEGTGRYLHPNPRAEAVGARDQWAVERAAGIPITEPNLDRAVLVLQRHARSAARSAKQAVRDRPGQPASPVAEGSSP